MVSDGPRWRVYGCPGDKNQVGLRACWARGAETPKKKKKNRARRGDGDVVSVVGHVGVSVRPALEAVGGGRSVGWVESSARAHRVKGARSRGHGASKTRHHRRALLAVRETTPGSPRLNEPGRRVGQEVLKGGGRACSGKDEQPGPTVSVKRAQRGGGGKHHRVTCQPATGREGAVLCGFERGAGASARAPPPVAEGKVRIGRVRRRNDPVARADGARVARHQAVAVRGREIHAEAHLAAIERAGVGFRLSEREEQVCERGKKQPRGWWVPPVWGICVVFACAQRSSRCRTRTTRRSGTSGAPRRCRARPWRRRDPWR